MPIQLDRAGVGGLAGALRRLGDDNVTVVVVAAGAVRAALHAGGLGGVTSTDSVRRARALLDRPACR